MPSSVSGFRDIVCGRFFLQRASGCGYPPLWRAEKGRLRVHRFNPWSGRRTGHRRRFICALPKAMDGGGFGPPLRMAPPYVRKFNIKVVLPLCDGWDISCRASMSVMEAVVQAMLGA